MYVSMVSDTLKVCVLPVSRGHWTKEILNTPAAKIPFFLGSAKPFTGAYGENGTKREGYKRDFVSPVRSYRYTILKKQRPPLSAGAVITAGILLNAAKPEFPESEQT